MTNEAGYVFGRVSRPLAGNLAPTTAAHRLLVATSCARGAAHDTDTAQPVQQQGGPKRSARREMARGRLRLQAGLAGCRAAVAGGFLIIFQGSGDFPDDFMGFNSVGFLFRIFTFF